jgi:hypothetical protein
VKVHSREIRLSLVGREYALPVCRFREAEFDWPLSGDEFEERADATRPVFGRLILEDPTGSNLSIAAIEDSRKRTSGYLLCRCPPRGARPCWSFLRLGGLSGFFGFVWDRAPDSILRAALAIAIAQTLNESCLAFGNRVPAPLRDHEGERTHVPCVPLKFDKRSLREVFINHMAWHVAPAQASLEEIVLRAEVIHPPLAFTGDPLLCLFRIGLIVRYNKLDVPAKFLPRDWPRD